MLALVLPLFAALSSAGASASASVAPTGLGVIATAEAAKTQSFLLRGSSERVHIVVPLLGGADEIESVALRSRANGSLLAPRHVEHWLEITLSAAAAEKLVQVSRQEIGGKLALVVHGDVVVQLVMVAPITTRAVAMHGFRDRDAAKAAANEIKAVLATRSKQRGD